MSHLRHLIPYFLSSRTLSFWTCKNNWFSGGLHWAGLNPLKRKHGKYSILVLFYSQGRNTYRFYWFVYKHYKWLYLLRDYYYGARNANDSDPKFYLLWRKTRPINCSYRQPFAFPSTKLKEYVLTKFIMLGYSCRLCPFMILFKVFHSACSSWKFV